MSTRRTERVASLIREVVSTAILFELRDPRIKDVTVLRVQVSPDVRYAKVYVSVRGTVKEQNLSMHGLNSARGLLQSKVGDFIKARYTPELRFVLDEGLKKGQEATALLQELFPHGAPPPEPEDAEAEATDPNRPVAAVQLSDAAPSAKSPQAEADTSVEMTSEEPLQQPSRENQRDHGDSSPAAENP